MQDIALDQSTSQLYRKESIGEIQFLTKDQFIQQFQEDLEQHYNIYQLQQSILNKEQTKLQDQQKLLSISLFLSISAPLIGFKILLKDALNQLGFKQLEEVSYSKIITPLKHMSHFIHEFLDEFTFIGLKNVKNYIEKTTNQEIIKQGMQGYYNQEQEQIEQSKQQQQQNIKVNQNYKRVIQNVFESAKDQKQKTMPFFDHRKYSSCMLIRSQSLSQNFNIDYKQEQEQHKKLQQTIISDSFLNFSSEFTDIQMLKEELIEYNVIKINQIFMADIAKHRYLIDNTNIEYHIQAAQCEKYKPSMDLIFESDENDQNLNNSSNIDQVQKINKLYSKNNIANQDFQLFDSLDDSEDEGKSESTDLEYEQDLKNLRIHIQKLLTIIIQSYEQKEFQNICKIQYDKNCEYLLQQIQDQNSLKNNNQNILQCSIQKYYYQESSNTYMNKILNLMQDIFPSFTCYIDFFQQQPYQIQQQQNGKLQKQNLKQFAIKNYFDNEYNDEDDEDDNTNQCSTTDVYDFNMNEIDYSDQVLFEQTQQQSGWLFL